MTTEQFISEPIQPVTGSMDTSPTCRGEPAFPHRFIWRNCEYEIAHTVATWKEDGPCASGSAERYLRKHWYHIQTTSGDEMKLYFQRQARSASTAKTRWWLYTVKPTPAD